MARILPLTPGPAPWLSGTQNDPALGLFAEVGCRLAVQHTTVVPGAVTWMTVQAGQVATGPDFIPGPDLDRQDLRVRVQVGDKIWQSTLMPLRLPAPAVAFEPYPEILDQGDGTETVPLGYLFDGDGLSYSSPDPINIDPASGLAAIPVTGPVSDGVITVVASNSGGRATIRVPYVVEPPSVRPVVFGALTCAGHGGCQTNHYSDKIRDTGGTGIALANGRIVAGHNPLQPGVITLRNGTQMVLEVAANEYSVADADEALDALKQAAPGSTVRLRPTARKLHLRLRGLVLDHVTLAGTAGHSVSRIEIDNCRGLTLQDLTVIFDNSAGADFKPGDEFYTCVIRNSHNITLKDCRFDCDPKRDGGHQTIASLIKRFGAVRTNRSSVEITECRFDRVRDAIVANWGKAYIHGCHFRQVFEDAITGLHTHWQVDDNEATLFEGTSVRDFPGQLSGTPRPGTIMRTASGDNAIEFIRSTGGRVRARLNNYNLPRNGQRFIDARGNSFTIQGRSKEAKGLNIHGDFFQPILLKNSPGDCQVIARRNFVYRTLPYSLGTISQEPNTQGILAQRNGGPHYHAPCEITHNVIATGQPIGIKAAFCGDGTISNNTVIWAEMGVRSDLEISRCRNLRVERNAGDNNSRGAVDDKGGHSNVSVNDNFFVQGRGIGQIQTYNAPFTYPQTRVGLSPIPGSVLDSRRAGALDSRGRFRR